MSIEVEQSPWIALTAIRKEFIKLKGIHDYCPMRIEDRRHLVFLAPNASNDEPYFDDALVSMGSKQALAPSPFDTKTLEFLSMSYQHHIGSIYPLITFIEIDQLLEKLLAGTSQESSRSISAALALLLLAIGAITAHKGCIPQATRNEAIPGLEYVDIATKILGNQMGGSTIQHVQAHLLACFYFGQLALVSQALSYFSTAIFNLQRILRR